MKKPRIPWEEKIRRLRDFCRREERLPGYAEMLAMFDFRSKNAVFGLLERLGREGYVRRGSDGKSAATRRLTGSVRLLGAVAAGFPSPAEEELVDILSLDEFLIRRPEATFMLSVSGDSMIEAGIQPGDLVLVERGRTPRNNDIVVAQVDDEWTIKYFIRDREGVRLEPANRKYKPIRPARSMTVGGVGRAGVRKYE